MEHAQATDTDGTVAQVEFFNGTTSIGVVTQAPFTTNWTNVATGSYSITAKATDNLGASTTSAAVAVTVAAYQPKVYDVNNDQLGTPRVITDSTGAEVWRWDSAPFGETPANEQPANQATKFSFNMRFPGQYFDAETNLHYNYFRDYDPTSGRYFQSDPIGLRGGINTYTYVKDAPVSKRDPTGTVAVVDDVVYAGVFITAACAASPGCVQAIRDTIASGSRLIKKAVKEMCEPTPEECKKEWSDARKYCNDAYDNGYVPGNNGKRGKGIGDMSYEQCVKGQVSEACGGSKVEW